MVSSARSLLPEPSLKSCHLVVTNIHGSTSRSGNQVFAFRITFYILATLVTIWLTGIGGILFALQAFSAGSNETRSIANGAVYMTVLALTIVINLTIIVPGVLMLQPLRLWNILKAERQAVTPRQRFRGKILHFYHDKSSFETSFFCSQPFIPGPTIQYLPSVLLFWASCSRRRSLSFSQSSAPLFCCYYS